MKIVVGGPPHSGKSVFLSGLVGQLDRQDYFLFRACPDGEGSWTYAVEENAKLRRKGEFCPEFVEWSVRTLHNHELAPVTLVDVGGRMSPENRQIMAECDSAVILSGDPAAIPAWRQFCQECGLAVIAELHSDYYGHEDVVEQEEPMVTGSVHFLERGEDVTARPIIEAVGHLINRLLDDQRAKDEAVSETAVLKVAELAEELGKKVVKKTLPNGREIETIIWEGDDIKSLSRLLHSRSSEWGCEGCVDIDGGAPGFVHATLAHECHPAHVRLNSPDGFVPIRCRAPEKAGSGENLEFSLEEKPKFMLVTCQQADPSLPLDPDNLEEVIPPEVPFGSVVVLNGRMPNWLLASLAMSYHGKVKAVACNQPGKGATVCWTHSAKVELGSVIPVAL